MLQGTQSAEVLAVAQAAGSAQGATAYLNMETGAAWHVQVLLAHNDGLYALVQCCHDIMS